MFSLELLFFLMCSFSLFLCSYMFADLLHAPLAKGSTVWVRFEFSLKPDVCSPFSFLTFHVYRVSFTLHTSFSHLYITLHIYMSTQRWDVSRH
jgi:hypothetical protein